MENKVSNEKVLTIIIPTYNMEKYLNKCLDSLIVSEEDMELLEILIINDGSKDNSSLIAHRYEKKYPQTFKVIDKVNGNYGSCINCGLMSASGKYVKVLDADDSFNTDEFEHYLHSLMVTCADLVITNYDIVNEKNIITHRQNYDFVCEKLLSIDSICSTSSFRKIQMHAITYKRQLLVDINYKQTEGIPYTDQEWIFMPMSVVCSCLYLNVSVYRYLVGRSGQTIDPQNAVKNLPYNIMVIKSRLSFFNNIENKLTDAKRNYLLYKLKEDIAFVYRYGLLKQLYEMNNLYSFDNYLLNTNKTIYNMLGKETIFNFRYIDYWRKKNIKLPFFIIQFYRLLRMLIS